MDFDQDMAFGANLYDDASPDILGVPNAQADFWDMQEFADNCEPTSESFIIRQFGFDGISTNDFAYISQANGWYMPGGGTSPEHMGDLMDLFGIDNHTIENASLEELANEIANGHGVIVGVNAGQLWDQGPLQELFNWASKAFGFDNPVDAPADHALCVTGFDVSDPDHPMVIVNDPGHPNGQGASYPLDRFMDAEKKNIVFQIQIFLLDTPDWRTKTASMLHPYPVSRQEISGWILAKADVPAFLQAISKRSDYTELNASRSDVPRTSSITM